MEDEQIQRIINAGLAGFFLAAGEAVKGELGRGLLGQQGQRSIPPAQPVRELAPRSRQRAGTGRRTPQWEAIQSNRKRARDGASRISDRDNDVPYEMAGDWKKWALEYEDLGNLSRAYECWGNYYLALRNR